MHSGFPVDTPGFFGGFVLLHVGRAVELKIDVEVRGTSVLTSFLTSSGGSTASSRKMPQVVKGIDIHVQSWVYLFYFRWGSDTLSVESKENF